MQPICQTPCLDEDADEDEDDNNNGDDDNKNSQNKLLYIIFVNGFRQMLCFLVLSLNWCYYLHTSKGGVVYRMHCLKK